MEETQTWYSPEQAELVKAKGWADPGAAVNSYAELEKSMGNRVRLPGEGPEEISAFYDKLRTHNPALGRPETPDGYTLPELPEGRQYDKNMIDSLRALSHEIGESPQQVKRLVEWYLGIQTQQEAAVEAEKERLAAEGDKELRELWGENYEPESVIVQRACDELIEDEKLHDEFAQLVEEKGLKNNRVFALVFNGIGKKMLDDAFVRGAPPAKEGEYIPEYPNDPDMYRSGDTEDCKKARAYFESKGHVY